MPPTPCLCLSHPSRPTCLFSFQRERAEAARELAELRADKAALVAELQAPQRIPAGDAAAAADKARDISRVLSDSIGVAVKVVETYGLHGGVMRRRWALLRWCADPRGLAQAQERASVAEARAAALERDLKEAQRKLANAPGELSQHIICFESFKVCRPNSFKPRAALLTFPLSSQGRRARRTARSRSGRARRRAAWRRWSGASRSARRSGGTSW